jgi:hypothetical protein
MTCPVRAGKPVLSNNWDEHGTLFDFLSHHVWEIFTWVNGVDVNEDVLLAKMATQVLMKSSRPRQAVVSSIADEDRLHWLRSTKPFCPNQPLFHLKLVTRKLFELARESDTEICAFAHGVTSLGDFIESAEDSDWRW